MSIPVAKAALLEGKKGLIVGVANQSIAWGCYVRWNCCQELAIVDQSSLSFTTTGSGFGLLLHR